MWYMDKNKGVEVHSSAHFLALPLCDAYQLDLSLNMPFGRSIPLTYSTAVTGLLFLQHAFDSYISQRQLGRLHHRSPPVSLQKYFKLLSGQSSTQETTTNFLQSQEYSKDKLKLSQFVQFIDLIENCLLYTPFIASFILGHKRPVTGLKALWDYSTSFDVVKGRGEIVQSLAFVTAVSLISKVTSVPLSLYKPFVLEAKVSLVLLVFFSLYLFLTPMSNPQNSMVSTK